MVRSMGAMGKNCYCCKECEKKSADLKSVLTSIENLASEVKTIKHGQEEQQIERERVIEGLKVVETVVRKIESIETVQAVHEERLTAQESATKKNDEKIDEGLKRLEAMEEKLRKTEEGTPNMRLTNAVVKEVREIERKEKNFVIWNVPESKEEAAEDRKKHDEGKVKDILKELKTEDVEIKNVIRVGKGGRYPGGILVITKTIKDCNMVMQSNELVQLANDVRIVPDKTFNQREEARQFRLEKAQQEQENPQLTTSTQGGGGRGRRPGRPKGSGRGGGGGRGQSTGKGGRGGGGGSRDDSRKRGRSGEDRREQDADDEESKRRKVTLPVLSPDPDANPSTSASAPPVPVGGAAAAATPTRPPLRSAGERQGTPQPVPRLAAAVDDDDADF